MLEIVEEWLLNGRPVTATYKGNNKPKKRAFLVGDTVTVYRNGEYYTRHKQNRSVFPYIALVEELKREGYSISLELQNSYQQELDWKSQTETENQNHFQACASQSARTGKPVVVSSCAVHTTATVGRNYKLVLPNGQIEVVSSGCPASSHGDKVYYSTNDASILEAIREYNKA